MTELRKNLGKPKISLWIPLILRMMVMLEFFSILACSRNLGDCVAAPRIYACTPESPEDQARRAMADHDYQTAVEILLGEVSLMVAREEDAPLERFRLHPLFAAAYAGLSGFNLLSAVENQAQNTSEDVLGQLATIVPSPQTMDPTAYSTAISTLKKAVDLLYEIPTSLLVELQDESYGKSAALQLTLYQTAHAVMLMNQFTISASSGGFDPSQLDRMTESDAEAILASLLNASQVPGLDQPAFQDKITQTLADIDAAEGASQRDKLSDFLQKKRGSQTN